MRTNSKPLKMDIWGNWSYYQLGVFAGREERWTRKKLPSDDMPVLCASCDEDYVLGFSDGWRNRY